MQQKESTKVLFGNKENGMIGIYIDGVLRRKIPYTNGKVQGIVELYNEQGSLIEKTEYYNGKKSGTSIKYKNDQIILRSNYIDGLLDGRTVSYYEDGGIESITLYKKGNVNGRMILYDRNGNAVYESSHQDGEITEYNVYDRHFIFDEFGEHNF